MHFLKIESYFNLNLSPHCFFFHQIPLDLAQRTLIECKIYFESDLKKRLLLLLEILWLWISIALHYFWASLLLAMILDNLPTLRLVIYCRNSDSIHIRSQNSDTLLVTLLSKIRRKFDTSIPTQIQQYRWTTLMYSSYFLSISKF